MTYLYLFFQLKIKQVAQQLDTNFRVQGLISLFICYLVLDINFLRKIRNLGRYNHSHTINSTVVILELKLSLFFLSKKRRRNIFDKAKVVCFKVQRPKVQKVMMLGGFKA